jgi:quercetin dioxygenase-like cupin family protein
MLEEEFSELMALAALETIDDEARQLADTYASTSEELEKELAELRDAVGTIPYGNELLPLSSNLKDRLFERIIEDTDRSASQANGTPASIEIRASERVWQTHPVPGITMSVLHIDPATRQISSLIRCEPGAHYPPHSHAGIEEIFMLEGDFTCDGKTYTSGDYILSACGSIHPLASTYDGCLFLVRTSMDNQFVEV